MEEPIALSSCVHLSTVDVRAWNGELIKLIAFLPRLDPFGLSDGYHTPGKPGYIRVTLAFLIDDKNVVSLPDHPHSGVRTRYTR